MDAPSETVLRLYVRGELPAAEAEAVEQWLARHPEAAETLDKLAAGDTLDDALRAQADAPSVEPTRVERVVAHVAGAEVTAAFDAPPAADTLSAKLGRLGDYPLVRVLGRGGMGTVYEARDEKLGRRLAVKVMRPEVAEKAEAKERFLREARAAAAVEHENVVPVYQVGEDAGTPFLVMPLLAGETLDDRLKRGPVPLAELLTVARQIADGLAAAHAAGLIHRDVKPSNVWLEAHADGSFRRVRVLDFGLARTAQAEGHLTHAGVMMGTPAFMAPEQAKDAAKVDHRADLFSLGGVLYRMATGQPAFAGDDAFTLLTLIATTTPRPAHVVNPAVPRQLSDLIARMLAKAPADRPASAAEVSRELAAVRPDAPRRRRRPAFAAVGAALLAVAAVVYGGQVVRVVTNKGELVIETDDPNVEVVVKQGAATVHDKTKGRSFVLTAGDGEVEFYDPETGVRAATKKFRITRGGKDAVTVTLAELAANRPDRTGLTAEQRKALEWVLSVGGYVGVIVNEKHVGLERGKGLPDGPFTLDVINLDRTAVDDAAIEVLKGAPAIERSLYLSGTRVTDAGLARLVTFPSLARITDLDLDGTRVTPDGLAHLKQLSRLDLLSLDGLQVSDAGLRRLKDLPRLRALIMKDSPAFGDAQLAHLKNLPKLDVLGLSGTGVTDVGLATVGELRLLRVLYLDGLPVTDTGLERLAGLKALRHLDVPGTKVSLAGVQKLSAALPRCMIESDHGTFGPGAAPKADPPARDAFPGEVIVYETFDDPKTCPLPAVKQAGEHARCEGGAFVTEYTAATPDVWRVYQFGGPATDVALVARVRGTNAGVYATFGERAGADLLTYLTFAIRPDGSWELRRVRLEKKAGAWQYLPPTPLVQSAAPEPDLVAGKWFEIRARTAGRTTQVWAGAKAFAEVTEPDGPDIRLPPGPKAVTVGGMVSANGPARFDIDHVAVWKLPPVPAGDRPPAKDAFPGELLAHETFDDPKEAKPIPTDKPGTPVGVENGAKVIGFVKLGEGNQLAVPFGRPAADVAVVARVRGTDATPYLEFRGRKSAARWSKVEFDAAADGSWRLRWLGWDRADGDWQLGPPKELAKSEKPDPDLAAGRWVTLVAKSEGSAVEVWANGRRLARVDADLPAADVPPGPEAAAVGGRALAEGGRLEIDYAAVWKLPAPKK